MTVKSISIPKISDKELDVRMKQIKWVVPAMVGVDGKPYRTQEEDEKLFSLVEVTSLVNARTQAFNFDDGRILKEVVEGLFPLVTTDIFVKTGGYHGFCKITFAEVMSQVPEEILPDVVAFALNPKDESTNLNEDYQRSSIIFYGQGSKDEPKEDLPSYKDLILPIDEKKRQKLIGRVRPILNFASQDPGDDFNFVDPGNQFEPFMSIGIWMRINGSNLHKNNALSAVQVEYKVLDGRVAVYQVFDPEKGADSFQPTYSHLINQIPDELINNDTIGLRYHSTDYFKTKEGVIHKSEYSLVEKV